MYAFKRTCVRAEMPRDESNAKLFFCPIRRVSCTEFFGGQIGLDYLSSAVVWKGQGSVSNHSGDTPVSPSVKYLAETPRGTEGKLGSLVLQRCAHPSRGCTPDLVAEILGAAENRFSNVTSRNLR